MPFRPGQSGNPEGRKHGTRNRKTLALAAAPIEAETLKGKNGRKVVNALALLSSIALRSEVNLALRISAATALAPYQNARKAHRYIDRGFDLPAPATVEEATQNIAQLGTLAAAGKIGLDEANDLIGYQRAYIEARVGLDIEGQMLELRQIVEKLSSSARPVDAVVIGGLGPLPGTRIEMPVLNRSTNGGEPGDSE
jgi:hypothetical protein